MEIIVCRITQLLADYLKSKQNVLNLKKFTLSTRQVVGFEFQKAEHVQKSRNACRFAQRVFPQCIMRSN